MSLVYFDSSALLSLVRTEPSTELMGALWDRADGLVASRLADGEVRAVLRAGERTGRLSAPQVHTARETWQQMWPALRKVEVTASIAEHGAHLAEEHGLRAGDGLQLASILLIGEVEPVVAITDTRLAEVAVGHGLRVLPRAG